MLLAWFGLPLNSCHFIPLGKVHEVVSRRTLSKAGNLEPAGLAVFTRAAVAGDSVADDFTAGAGGVDLGSISEVTNDGDLGERSSRGGAESTGSKSRSDSGAAKGGRERHGACLFYFSLFRFVVC